MNGFIEGNAGKTAAVPKVYKAIMSQTGTDAPVADIQKNTLGGTVVWTRISAGKYRGTLAGAFPAGKVRVYATCGTQGFNTMSSHAHRYGTDAIQLSTTLPAAASALGDVWNDLLLEVEVYP